MKNKISFFLKFTPLSFMLLLFGCTTFEAALYTSMENKSEYQSVDGKPEDSVIFYGYIENVDTNSVVLEFTQVNPDFDLERQSLRGKIFVSKPVRPGTVYFLEGMSGQFESFDLFTGSKFTCYNKKFALERETTPIVIDVPEKPGFYFVGAYLNPIKLIDGSAKKYDNMLNEKMCLKGALRLYKGTAWEKAIKARLSEL